MYTNQTHSIFMLLIISIFLKRLWHYQLSIACFYAWFYVTNNPWPGGPTKGQAAEEG